MSFRNPNGSYIRPGYDPLEVANPPTGASATAGNTTASVSFTAPTNTGGSSIMNYYAVSDPGQITASSVTSPISVTGLTNGTSYTFKVWAANSYGPSAYSAPTGTVTPSPPYVEDVFSTYLYRGTGSSQTITNGINLSSDGGMLWIKPRETTTFNNHMLYDTARGLSVSLTTNNTDGNDTNALGSFNTDGFGLTGGLRTNTNGVNYVSWTFEKAPKFFDVVTYTGNGAFSQVISHNLGSIPGAMFIKRTDTTGDWYVYHRNVGNDKALILNSQAASATSAFLQYDSPTSTNFTVGDLAGVNANGGTYVAYLFAHNAGGFGESGSDNVITCGSFSTGTGNVTVNLGYEPQWIMYKRTNGTGNWLIVDNMRGWFANAAPNPLIANDPAAEPVGSPQSFVNATGFSVSGSASQSFVYIAIRRGPMKTPTSGTSVFSPVLGNSSGTIPNFQSNFVTDAGWMKTKNNTSNIFAGSRLQGAVTLFTNLTDAEAASTGMTWDSNSGWGSFGRDSNNIGWSFRRAPGFFDVVCYTGDGVSGRSVIHNLGVAPEFLMVKERSGVGNWEVIVKDAPAGRVFFELNGTGAGLTSRDGHLCFPTATFVPPTSTEFVVGSDDDVNGTTFTYVSYLFASVAGVSKIGSYTGTGTTQQINCGFTSGARFVLIKRTDSSGDWYVWDSARGIVAGNDPYLLLNSAAAEVTNTDYVDTYSLGFEISSTAPAGINANGGSYIFLAIA